MPDFTELKQKHRAVWASGGYNQIARGIQAVADHSNEIEGFLSANEGDQKNCAVVAGFRGLFRLTT